MTQYKKLKKFTGEPRFKDIVVANKKIYATDAVTACILNTEIEENGILTERNALIAEYDSKVCKAFVAPAIVPIEDPSNYKVKPEDIEKIIPPTNYEVKVDRKRLLDILGILTGNITIAVDTTKVTPVKLIGDNGICLLMPLRS